MSTTEDLKQGWTSSPDGRGTLDIMWSCLSALIICCWTVIHPDIPTPSTGSWRRVLDKSLCMLAAIVAPEAVLAVAWGDWSLARKPLPDEMGIVHGFFANMGGFEYDSQRQGEEVGSRCRRHHSPKLHDGARYLDTNAIGALGEQGYSLEYIPSNHLMDKSKNDNMIKAVAILQALYLAAQCIARRIQHLEITTLEVSTVAYLPCALLSYCFWWNKPSDVRFPIAVRIFKTRESSEKVTAYRSTAVASMAIPAVADIGDSCSDRVPTLSQVMVTVKQQQYQSHPLAMKILRIGFPSNGFEEWIEALPKYYFADFGAITALGSAMFGLIHCLAWNFSFPTPIEQLLWRIGSTALIGGPALAWILSGFLFRAFDVDIWKGKMWYCLVCRGLSGIAFAFYLCARLYLIFEVFFAFRSLPVSCYQSVQWTQYVPHL